MQTTQVLFLTLMAVLLGCSLARNIPQHASRHREKRQYGDIKMSQHQAEAGLGKIIPHACKQYACGLVNPHTRVRRAASDQRIAELQALIALANGGGSSVGHGQFDPYAAGKKKRSDSNPFESSAAIDTRRINLLSAILDSLAPEDRS